MSTFALLSTLVTLGALFGVLSHRFLKLPVSIGTVLLSLSAVFAFMVGGRFVPGLQAGASHVVAHIDFNEVVLHGMLAFLLFAGAMQLDLDHLRREKLPIAVLALGGTALSTVIVAALFKWALLLIGMPLSWLGALLFGALISPTDPIAVLDMLRRLGAPAGLESQLAGESLFNDGIGAVLFVALVEASGSGSLPAPGHFFSLLLVDAGGAVLLGSVLGYITYRLLRLLDSYSIEVMLTLALAMGGYALADSLGLSAPLEVVTAGLFVSGRARSSAMSEETREHVDKFWELIDNIMNVILFLLLGLELLVVPIQKQFVFAGLLAIPVVLLARLGSVSAASYALSVVHARMPRNIPVLTWGGLRGGLAVALALALPHGLEGGLLVVTYVVVVFSIVVQGLTIGPLLRRMGLQSRA